jgi:predicted amidohydrolase
LLSTFPKEFSGLPIKLRYPETALSLKRLEAQIITYSSDVTVPTGKAHWELFLRARAIETQSYCSYCSGRAANEKSLIHGYSIIVGALGEIFAILRSWRWF